MKKKYEERGGVDEVSDMLQEQLDNALESNTRHTYSGLLLVFVYCSMCHQRVVIIFEIRTKMEDKTCNIYIKKVSQPSPDNMNSKCSKL